MAWWGPELGPESREAIKAAAILHFEGAPDFTRGPPSAYRRGTLFDHAAVLAGALQDPELAAIARDARHRSTGESGIPDRVREMAPSWERALQRAADTAGGGQGGASAGALAWRDKVRRKKRCRPSPDGRSVPT